MTSPAIIVLSLALVCSIFCLASDQTADHVSRLRTEMSMAEAPKMGNHWTNTISKKHINYNENIEEVKSKVIYDEIYEDIQARNLDIHRNYVQKMHRKVRNFDESTLELHSRVKRQEQDPRCILFNYDPNDKYITHPHPTNSGNNYYYNNSNCVTKINATNNDMVIQLTFVDVFRIEYHPECAYDYLEIRDGYYGYADLMGKFCGETFPRTLKTKGPNVWLKFHSDDTIEYEGFKINIEFKEGPSHHISDSCYKTFDNAKFGIIDTDAIDPICKSSSKQALDFLWTIIVPENMKIYLNFTSYALAKPNECNENIIQVFETVHQEMDTKLAEYCGSVANSVTTKEQNGNTMYVRLYVTKESREGTKFNATFNAYRNLDTTKEEKCNDNEFDCEDSTCIDILLMCDDNAHCRLKADEDKSKCEKKTDSTINQVHVIVILVIFSLILSGMSFVFIFKCIRKLYEDHKMIKEHIRQSCEDRLDDLGSRLTLDPKRLQSEPRVSLERENHKNEMKRSFSKHKQSSIESNFQETHLDMDEDLDEREYGWRREVEGMPIEEEVRIERNGRTRKSDLSRKEESMRSRTKESEDSREKKELRERKEIRDVSVGAPDTKESGCQTRESLFQTDPPPSSDGSGTNSRGFSTFGYSGATIVRPSPPATTNTSEITIELLKQIPSHQETKPQKKLPDRRPISTETTRSAPDVIIVSKPIR